MKYLVIAFSLLMLSGCVIGTATMKMTNPDGSVVMVEKVGEKINLKLDVKQPTTE